MPSSAAMIGGTTHQALRLVCANIPASASATTAPAARRQSSPMTKSYQNRPKARSRLTGARSRRSGSEGTGAPAQLADQPERQRRVEREHAEDHHVRAGPVHAGAFGAPERPERGEHQPDTKLHGVLRDATQGPVHDEA